MMNQKTAVVNTILSVLEERGVSYEMNGDLHMCDVLNETDKKTIRDILFTAFRSGQVSYSAEFQPKVDVDSELKKYVSGLLNNWIKKNKEFNNGEAHKIKNPGSRAGTGDEQIREMKKLLALTTDATAKKLIQASIDSRLAEIKPSATVEINYDAIPEALRKQLGL